MEASSERPIPNQVTFADYGINSKHMDRHDRPYRCGRTECGHLKGFTYSGGLLRHERDVHSLHGGPKDQLRCKVSTCKRHAGKGFTRKEKLVAWMQSARYNMSSSANSKIPGGGNIRTTRRVSTRSSQRILVVTSIWQSRLRVCHLGRGR